MTKPTPQGWALSRVALYFEPSATARTAAATPWWVAGSIISGSRSSPLTRPASASAAAIIIGTVMSSAAASIAPRKMPG